MTSSTKQSTAQKTPFDKIMHLNVQEESPSKSLSPAEAAADSDEAQNTSNNGHKYIPEEHDIRYLKRHFYPNGTCVFEDRLPGLYESELADLYPHKRKNGENYLDYRGCKDLNTEYNLWFSDGNTSACRQSDTEADEEPDVEIVFSQDVVSGELCCDVVFADDLEEFITSLIKRKVLATSYTTVTHKSTIQEIFQETSQREHRPVSTVESYSDTFVQRLKDQSGIEDDLSVPAHAEYDYRHTLKEEQYGTRAEDVYGNRNSNRTDAQPSARSPGGDSLSHIHVPGLLHVPHLDDLPTRHGRHVTFGQHGPDTDTRDRGRAPYRRQPGRDRHRYNDGSGCDKHMYNDRYSDGRNWRGNAPRNNRRLGDQAVKPNQTDQGNVKPPYENRNFYSGRYYNENTYYSEPVPCEYQHKQSGEQQSWRVSQGNRDTGRKTNTSRSEGDLPRSRHTYQDARIDTKPPTKTIGITIKKREPVENTSKTNEVKNETKDKLHEISNQITEKTPTKTDHNQAYTQSVSVSGPVIQKPTEQQPDDADTKEEDQGEKTKKKKKRRTKKKTNKKPEKSQQEILQRQADLGQLKSFFSKYRTEGLKNLKLTETLHTGTFSTKYKSVYQNEAVIMSVYLDQDVSDIAAVDMAHMRRSYFVDCLKDCIRGPGGSLWLMTKFCRLGDLNQLLQRDRPRHVIGEVHAQFITAGLLIGVDYLHRNDIVHGNIKPSKILFNNEGFPVLTGFLKLSAGSEPRDVYTPAYAAPERFRGDRDAAADIFSVGCVAYEIITGRTPFDGDSLDTMKANILSASYRPWYDPELVSYAGEMFIDHCLKKKVSERFTLGENGQTLQWQEWFSMLGITDLKRQVVHSPILDAVQLLENRARLSWEEKVMDYRWGRVMDCVCPNTPTMLDR